MEAVLIESHEDYNVYQCGKMKVYTIGKPDVRNMPPDVFNDFCLQLGKGCLKWKMEQQEKEKELLEQEA